MLFIGAISALGAMVIEFAVSIFYPAIQPELLDKFSGFIILAVCIEELVKFAVIRQISKREPVKKNIFLNSVFIGVGFSLAEIGLNSLSAQFYKSIAAFLGLLIIHTLTASLMGYYFSLPRRQAGRQEQGKIRAVVVFSLVIFLHSSYNWAILQGWENYFIDIIFLTIAVFLGLIGLIAERKKISCQIEENKI